MPSGRYSAHKNGKDINIQFEHLAEIHPSRLQLPVEQDFTQAVVVAIKKSQNPLELPVCSSFSLLFIN